MIVLALVSWAFASPDSGDDALRARSRRHRQSLDLDGRICWSRSRAEPRLWDGMVIVSWFWLVGAVVLSLLPALVKASVGGTEGVVTLCLAVFAIGIAVGSLVAAQLSHVRPNLALVPIGAIVMGVVGLDLAWTIGSTVPGADIAAVAFAASFAGLQMLADFSLFAIGGGLFVVPSFAAVQAWSAPSERARVIAAGNVLQAAFMVVGSLLRGGPAGARPSGRLDLLRPRDRKLRRGLVRAQQMGQGRRARFRRAAVPGAVPRRGPRPGKPAAGRHPHADRAQPRQPDRRPAAARRAADRRELCGRYRDCQGVVGEAVPED